MQKITTMIKDIIQIGDKRLLEKSELVPDDEIGSAIIKSLAEDLIDTCKFHVNVAAGLSAVQLGILKRIFVVRRLDLEDNQYDINNSDIVWDVMINPEMKVLDKEEITEWEGCMSINSGNSRLFGPVSRPSYIEIKYKDLDRVEHILKAEGFFSHLIQHEFDHLNGILFLSHIKNPENIWKEDKLDEYLDKNKTFPPIK